MIIEFNSKSLGDLLIREIDKKIAKEIIINNHYSKKWNNNFGVINVGVFKKENPEVCLGVASFGNPMNPKAFSKISENVNQDSVLELNRMWIDDILGKNAESILISKSFKIIKEQMPHVKIIQSFADGRLGCGTIYKATNFRYYGFSKTIFFKHKETNETFHKMMFEKTSRPKAMANLCYEYVCDMFDIIEVKTYRYLYCLEHKFYKNIKLKELPYPEYEKGMNYINKEFSLNNMVKAYILLNCFKDIEKGSKVMDYIRGKYKKEEIENSLKESLENVHIQSCLKQTRFDINDLIIKF